MAKERLKNAGSAERSAFFARREAAHLLRRLLKDDEQRRASASIKSLVYTPRVRNKKATFALLCQTLKYLPILKKVLSASKLMISKWKRQAELIYIITYDVLFGQDVASVGDAEKFVQTRRNLLQSTLVQLCIKENVKCPQDLLPKYIQDVGLSRPQYVRVNTLKGDVESAFLSLKETSQVKRDDLISDLLVLPARTDLHNHPLVMNGNLFLQVLVFYGRLANLFMQGKASCMAAVALSPHPDWEVLDACAAPGNKTVQLAGLMKGRGKIFACELTDRRLKRLKETVKLSGASNVKILHADFLKLDPNALKFSKIRAILLDPSCSGSGIKLQRLDHLLPSHAAGHGKDVADLMRVNNLAAFQKKALLHALSFPTVERIVYSTCSIHQTENEDVISSVLPHAHALNFHLETPFPGWANRGFPVFEGAQHLLRTEAAEDIEGFFIALFVRQLEKLQHLDNSKTNTHIIPTANLTKTCTYNTKLVVQQKYNVIKTKERSGYAKARLQGDSLLAFQKFTVSPIKSRSHSRKSFLHETKKMHKRSIATNLVRKGFGSPKLLHLLYIINCKRMKTKKKKMQNLHLIGSARGTH